MKNFDFNDNRLNNFALLVQTTREATSYIESYIYKKTGHKAIQLQALYMIQQNGGSIHPYQLARLTQTMPHNITTLIRRLERAGFVKSERVNSNRKFKKVEILDKGKKILEEAAPVVQKAVVDLMDHIGSTSDIYFQKRLRFIRDMAHELNNPPESDED